ncbi:MAG: polyprenyl synthetase [Candidatus Marinimicrobia bacterium]|nr:polyprenyl synthetase [Candidatus Neomarinimicrobiota bacterium]
MISLKQITSPILDDIDIFKTEFKEALNSEVKLINSISGYLLKNRGKTIRPIMTILCARLCGNPTKNTYKAAVMMELLHVATLIHDDIVDDAKIRRGKPSIKQIWKNKISVLMGDFILSKALINMVGLKDFDALDLISRTAEKLSAGEIMQIEKSLTRNMPKNVYYDMINQKTASLIAASCELGAITTTKVSTDRKSTFDYGENLGMAFQIKDDLFDFLGSENQTGKDHGGDVKKNMLTLPLIYSIENASRTGRNRIKSLVRKKKKSAKILKEINDIIYDSGGFDYAKKKLDEFSDKATDSISSYAESEIKKSLINLVVFNKERVG